MEITRDNDLDITGKIGDLKGYADREVEWPMYSFDRPAMLFWNGIANGLSRRGWSEESIKDWLQSSCARHWLDGKEDLIELLALSLSHSIRSDQQHL